NAVDVEQELAYEERDAGPENQSGEQDDGSLAPFPGERHQQECEGGDEDHDVAVTEPPGIAEIDMGVHHHGLCLAGAALVLNGALRGLPNIDGLRLRAAGPTPRAPGLIGSSLLELVELMGSNP